MVMQNNAATESVKIQLTKSALERLIGDSPELQLQLTNQVAEEVVKKYVVKALKNDEKFNQLSNKIEKDLNNQIAQRIGTFEKSWSDNYANFQLRPEVRQKVEDRVRLTVENEVNKIVSDSVTKAMSSLDERIQKRIDVLTNERITHMLQVKLQETFAKVVQNLK